MRNWPKWAKGLLGETYVYMEVAFGIAVVKDQVARTFYECGLKLTLLFIHLMSLAQSNS